MKSIEMRSLHSLDRAERRGTVSVHRRVLLAGVLALAVIPRLAGAAADQIRHDLTVDLDPVTHRIEIVDRVTLSGDAGEGAVEFLLNGAFTVTESTVDLDKLPAGEIGSFFSINASPERASGLELVRYRLEEALQHAIGRQADGVEESFLLQEAVDLRVGEGGVACGMACQMAKGVP